MKRKLPKSRRNIVNKSADEDKVSRVLREFKEGRLKTKEGKLVTSKEQAIAIALSEAGVTSKDMGKFELRNKLLAVRKDLSYKLEKEMIKDKAVRVEVINFFKKNPQPTDAQLHEFAQRMNMDPSDLETIIYSILSDLVSGGESKGKINPVDKDELALGLKTEREHTNDESIAEKIVRDHLAEDPKYYSKLREAKL